MAIIGNINRAISIQGEVIAKRGLKGEQGEQGIQGETGNGISSAVLNADYTLTLTFTNGTSYTTPSIRGSQGAKGDDGDDGKGITSITKTSTSGLVDTYTITFTDGTTTTFTVTNGDTPTLTWENIQGKPETYPPSSHNHNTLYYSKSEVYNKTETDTAISNHHDSSKADASTTYTKSEVDSAISGHHDSTKADVGTSYTKAEEDALLDDKADAEDIPTKTSDLTNDSGFITEHQSLSAYRTSADQDVIDNTKVDKVEGKGLSTNDFTDTLKTKLDGIEANADVTDADNVKASGATMGVKVAGTELTKDSDGKVNVPYGSASGAGVVWCDSSYGMSIVNGWMQADSFTLGTYNLLRGTIFMSKGTLENIKTDLFNRARLGNVKTTMDSVAIANAEYYLGEQSTVAITLPSTPSTGDEILVCFTSGATACTLTCDLQGFSFVPKANKTSWIKFTCYDATSGSVKWLVETKEG